MFDEVVATDSGLPFMRNAAVVEEEWVSSARIKAS
jgi:hypothetical protein